MNRRNFILQSLSTGVPLVLFPELLAGQNFKMSTFNRSNFGSNFLWGVATAAYQTEGAFNIDGKGLSIWDAFTNKERSKRKTETGNLATNFYHHYEKDISLLKHLNFDHFRFSISWSRILPNGIGTVNQKGIDYYNRLIDYCLKLNITPWITLYHWDLPLALEKKGGWTNREVLSWFQEFTTVVTKAFGDRAKNWIVLNEPMVFTSLGYLTGYHAPGKKGLKNYLPSIHHATLAQSIGGRIIREQVPDSNIGSTFSCSVVEADSSSEKNIKAAIKVDTALNRLFIEPCLGLGYPEDDLPILKKLDQYKLPNDEDLVKFDFDFHGIQYYFRVVVKHSFIPPLFAKEIKPEKRNVLLNQMNLEVFPQGIELMLKKFSDYKGVKKLLITESGVCFKNKVETDGSIQDNVRTSYYKRSLESILKAKTEGSKCDGFFAWTLTDNFEWSEGFAPHFGLIHFNRDNFERTIKDSGYWFKTFLQD